MSASRQELLRQEVDELTEMLRSADVLEGLRVALRGRGLQVEGLLLAGFVEDEEEREWGALVSEDARVFIYERSTAHGSVGFSLFEEVTDSSQAIAMYPAVEAALGLIKNRRSE